MPDSPSPAVRLGDVALPTLDFLGRLHQRGRLLPLLREAAVEQLLLDEATRAGLSASPEELQAAADAFRRQRGLASAEATRAWLARERLSAHDFEAVLERDLLIAKLKDHLTRGGILGHFAAHKDDYALARFRQVLVEREDLARELLSQIEYEGADFSELARTHSLHPSKVNGGAVGPVLRRQLPPEIASAVFTASPGAIVGPLSTPQGFLLLQVEERRTAEPDAATLALVRQELFDAWLVAKLKAASVTFPLLDIL